MRQFLTGNRPLIRQLFAAGFFHFIHALVTILLLLLVGQMITQTDSTKSRLLQLLLLGKFRVEDQWYWVFGLLILKFFGTASRNYFLQVVPFNMQTALQQHLLLKNIGGALLQPEKDIKRYARALIKGHVVWVADLFLLILIFLLLLHLHVWVAISWILLWIIGIVFRGWVVHYYLKRKQAWKLAGVAFQRKWKFLVSNRHALKRDQQWKKDVRILFRREKKARQLIKSFAFQKAWTSGFYPVYFFGFIFLLARVFQVSETDSAITLQLVLLIIYSQSAFMRSFRAPEHWRMIQWIEEKWKTAFNQTESKLATAIPDEQLEQLTLKLKNQDTLNAADCKELMPLFYSTQIVEESFYKNIFSKIALLDLNNPLRGETFLSFVLSDKESVQQPVLFDFFLSFKSEEWHLFHWKAKADRTNCTERQLVWLHLFKCLLHPGGIIICKDDLTRKLDREEIDIFLSLVAKTNKKIFYVYE